MKAMRVLLYLLAVTALAVTVQLPTAHGHEAAHHDHHGHHHEHHGHAHGHSDDGHGHEHGHHDHHDGKHVEEAHAHAHHHHDHDHHDHDHHDHKHVKEAHDAHDHHGHHHDDHHGHHHHGHHHGHHDHHHQKTPASKGAAGQAIDRFSPRVWAEALFATALVGAAPVVVLLFVPLGRGSAEAQKPLLRVFLSFAAGGLMGDALLHLLPHSLPAGGHAHDHGHGHHDHGHDHGHAHSLADLAVWLYCLSGMMAFLMLEKFVRAQTGDGHGHSHGHSHSPRKPPRDETPTPDGLRRRNVAGKKTKSSDDETPANDSQPSKAPARISAAGYLNLAADFSHNFTDGLAIGATFLRGSGWQTTVAMLLHEVPHEIGDFAILIQSGFTRRQAMLTQLGTALGAMAGTVLGLLIEGAGDSGSAWISPFTAGGFIYIACASVMPELLEDCSLKQSLQEGVAMCLGIGLMVVIALYE